jgi:hypothetical protein
MERPRSGSTRIAVGETNGETPVKRATPAGSNVFSAGYRGLTPTAIHVQSRQDSGQNQDSRSRICNEDIEFTPNHGPAILRAGKWKLHRNRPFVPVGGITKIGSP